jgi:hypothetical protein
MLNLFDVLPQHVTVSRQPRQLFSRRRIHALTISTPTDRAA